MASREISHIAARNVRPLDFSKLGMDGLSLVGIGIDEAVARKMATGMDAIEPTVTTGSVTTPVQFLQAWMPGFVKVVTSARKIDELVGIQTIGSWEDEEIVQGMLEVTGSSAPYTGLSTQSYSSWNNVFERRTVVRFKDGMMVDSLEEARASKINMNAAGNKREGAALALEISRNSIGLYGYNDGDNRTYGFLNDPSLPAYSDVATGTGGTGWSVKTFLEITADIREAASALEEQSGGLIDTASDNITVAIPTESGAYLSVTSDYGVSVQDWINKTYKNM